MKNKNDTLHKNIIKKILNTCLFYSNNKFFTFKKAHNHFKGSYVYAIT